MELMATKAQRAPRRTEALSRDVIVQAATEILDAEGEDALTLRALTVRLATGYGAIYHHVADRDDLLAAATDHVIARIAIARIAGDLDAGAGPRPALRAVASGLFDAIVAHPWVGAQLSRDPLRPALLDIYESISQQLQALDVPQRALSDSAGVLVNYILGVAGQNAANARALASSKMDRSAFLAAVAERWAQLDPARYPSVRKAGTQLPEHDDREQFLAGIDLILAGIETVNRAGKDSSAR
jgi:AcrR family transcriptional regulator